MKDFLCGLFQMFFAPPVEPDPLAGFTPRMLDDLPLRPCGVFMGYRHFQNTGEHNEHRENDENPSVSYR